MALDEVRKQAREAPTKEIEEPKNPPYVSIAFACNNPNTGMFTGKFDAVRVGSELLELNNRYWPPKELAIAFEIKGERHGSGFGPYAVKGRVKISRRRFPIVGYKYGWGNWCWDLVVVTPEVAVDVINYLKELNAFTCEGGDIDFFDRFNNEGEKFEKDEETLAALRESGWQRP